MEDRGLSIFGEALLAQGVQPKLESVGSYKGTFNLRAFGPARIPTRVRSRPRARIEAPPA
jgi:hypothetical protein